MFSHKTRFSVFQEAQKAFIRQKFTLAKSSFRLAHPNGIPAHTSKELGSSPLTPLQGGLHRAYYYQLKPNFLHENRINSIDSNITHCCFSHHSGHRCNCPKCSSLMLWGNVAMKRCYSKKKVKEANDEGVADLEFDIAPFKMDMEKQIDSFKDLLREMQVGRANPALIEQMKVKLPSGEVLPIKSLGTVGVKNPRLMTVTLFEPVNNGPVARTIRDSDIGFETIVSNNIIDVPVPKLTREIREGIVKKAKHSADAAKERIRSVRRDGMQKLSKLKKKGAPKDFIFEQEGKLQILTDKFVQQIDSLFSMKEKEILNMS